MTNVTTQAFDEYKKMVETEIIAIKAEIVKLREEEVNYRTVADNDIKAVISTIKSQFTIEGQQTNDRMEAIAAEARSRDEMINNKLDAMIQESQMPRTGERELKTKQIELQTQVNQVNIRLQELGGALSQVRAKGGGKRR